MTPLPSGASLGGKFAAADDDRIACVNEARMPLGQFQAQHVGIGGDLGDGLARHDNRADRDGDGQDAALRGRKDIAFFNLLGNHGALRLGGFQGIRSHFGSGARFIKLRACSEAPLRKLLLALSLGFRSFRARAQADD